VSKGGYQVGGFPPLWLEWNGKYRDCVRDYWGGQDQTLGEFAKAPGVFLNGEGIDQTDARGEKVTDDSFYVLFNAHYEPLPFTLPKGAWGEEWTLVLDTNELAPNGNEQSYKAGDEVPVESRSLKVLRRAA
jgi:glycogen operon protein